MAIQNHHQSDEQTQEQESHFFLLDALYCEEEQRWEEEDELEHEQGIDFNKNGRNPSSLLPLLMLEQDLFWEDEELLSLFSKEEAQRDDYYYCSVLKTEPSVSPCSVPSARGEAVEWMLRVSAHHGFSALTAVLAVDYVDRFLSKFLVQPDTWMIQLVAVACLSLAAKIEETYVPLLLDFQVGEAKYVFEAKTIQRMELLVLSTLRWKMHPVTPLSFLDHIVRRLGLRSEVHWEFFRRCETLLLSVVSDSRSVGYLPSALATAAMMHVIEEVETCNPVGYTAQLLRVLRMSKEKVEGCYKLILEISTARISSSHKRKLDHIKVSTSPSGVTTESCLSSYDDISSINECCKCATGASQEEHHQRLVKRSRLQLPDNNNNNSCNNNNNSNNFPSLSRVFVHVVRSPH